MALPAIGDLAQSGSIRARLKMDEESSGAAPVIRVDSVGSNDLTDHNNIPSGDGFSSPIASAPFSAELSIASAHWLDTADDPSVSITGDLTLSLLLAPSSLPAAGARIALCCKWKNSVNADRSWIIELFNDSGTQNLIFAVYDGAGSTVAAAAHTLTIDSFQLVGFVYDASAGEIKFFVDGEQVGTTQTSQKTNIQDGNAVLEFGRLQELGRYYGGRIQDAVLQAAEVTDAEMAANAALYISEGLISPDLINRKCPTGQTCFVSQYMRHSKAGTTPWKLPDGTPF